MKEPRDLTDAWLALNRAPGISTRRLAALIRSVESPLQLLRGNSPGAAWPELPPRFKHYLRNPDWAGVARDRQHLRRSGRNLLTLGDALYPSALNEIDDPPIVLFVEGDANVISRPAIAIVGSRHATYQAKNIASRFASQLARAGFTIVSGMAAGVDGAAHRGALSAEGLTVAISGCGPDRIYPSAHKALARSIAESGALISEYPCATAALPQNFPRRNRVISGLCMGVVVVEAAVKSGSLITARFARDQGREVFAVPGSIDNPLARGCHRLIRDGAKLVECVSDILIEVAPQLRLPGEPSADKSAELGPEYRALLQALDYESTHPDALVARTRLTPQVVSSMLLQLELDGYVSAVSGGCYARVTRNTR